MPLLYQCPPCAYICHCLLTLHGIDVFVDGYTAFVTRMDSFKSAVDFQQRHGDEDGELRANNHLWKFEMDETVEFLHLDTTKPMAFSWIQAKIIGRGTKRNVEPPMDFYVVDYPEVGSGSSIEEKWVRKVARYTNLKNQDLGHMPKGTVVEHRWVARPPEKPDYFGDFVDMEKHPFWMVCRLAEAAEPGPKGHVLLDALSPVVREKHGSFRAGRSNTRIVTDPLELTTFSSDLLPISFIGDLEHDVPNILRSASSKIATVHTRLADNDLPRDTFEFFRDDLVDICNTLMMCRYYSESNLILQALQHVENAFCSSAAASRISASGTSSNALPSIL